MQKFPHNRRSSVTGKDSSGRRSRYRTLAFESLSQRRVLTTLAGLDTDLELAEGESPTPLPQFSLLDVNASSASANQPIAPADYLQEVSAWYFGHAT